MSHESQIHTQQQITKLNCPASLESLSLLSKTLRCFGQLCDLSDVILYGMDLAISEAATNIIRHGLHYDTEQTIHIQFRYTPALLEVVLEDNGRPIPEGLLSKEKLRPWSVDNPDEWPEGGMGLMLICAMVDKFSYEAGNQKNVLTLTKYLPHSENTLDAIAT